MEDDILLDDWLDKLESEWSFRHRKSKDFQPMQYDYTENSYYEGRTIEETITEYLKVYNVDQTIKR